MSKIQLKTREKMSEEKQQYKSVLKSTSLIGGSAFINILITMVKTKFVAVLLGPTGVGLQNMYVSIITAVSSVTNLGLNSSGVRSIAEANGQGDSERVSNIIKTIRYTLWFSGVIGVLAMILFSKKISEYSFGNFEHQIDISILSIIVLLINIQVGQTCILQGLRKITDIAKISIWGAVNGTLISIPCFYLWGQAGIVPSLIITHVASLFVSWSYAKKIKVSETKINAETRKDELKKLLSFGLPVMGLAVMGSVVAYLMRLIIMYHFKLEGVGIWSAAFAISGVLTNFVLNAMGTDYYPRLASVSNDNEKISQELNTQLEVALLLSAPTLIVTILFAPIGIQLLYSGKFDSAIPILRWSVYGIFGRVVSHPLAYIMPAKGRGVLFFTSDLISHIIHLTLLHFCNIYFGFQGTGIAFMLNYVFYCVFMLAVAKIIANSTFTKANVKLTFAVCFALVLSSLFHIYVTNIYAYYFSATAMTAGVVYLSLKRLSKKTGLGFDAIKRKFKRA